MNKISKRKKEHLDICINENPTFNTKTNGFDKYDFVHCAVTEVDISTIDLVTDFFNHKIKIPFLISCMTGGTSEADNINAKLSEVASALQIPIGVGSQREMIDNSSNINSYGVIRKYAKNVPVMSNLGAAQVLQKSYLSKIQSLIDIVEASVFVIHLNPLQELFQKDGEVNFAGLLNSIESIVNKINIPVVVKEVGSGIDKNSAQKLLNVGVKGIDVAGAGGTSWSAVEMIRNKNIIDNYFWNWGLPTSYCIRTVNQLKMDYNFLLIASGGIKNGVDIAKSIALGADLTASARTILKTLVNDNIDGVIKLINSWMETLKKIMYLTNSASLDDLRTNKIQEKEKLI